MATSRLLRYPSDVARAFAHAPLEAAYPLLVAAAFSWAVEIDQGEAFRAWWWVVLVVLPAAMVAWTATILHALGDWTARRRWSVSVGAAILAAALGAFFLDMEREADVWRAATLVVAVVLAAAAWPALGLATSEEALHRFRRLGGRFVLRVVGAALYAGALFVGLALAIAAVDALFELDMEGTIYGHVFGWIAFAIAPWIVAGGLPDLVRPLEERSETMALVHRVAAWLVLPLLVLYYAILYAYSIRILVLGELPSNLVSPLVAAAALLGAGALVLFDRGPSGALGSKALRLTPLLFLPLVGLGIYAVLIRVQQYGWTEFRWVRLWTLSALAGLALAAAAPAIRRRPFAVHLAPLVVGIVLALSVIGPWGAPNVARRSQHARLVGGLEEAGLLRDGSLMVDTAGDPVELPAEVHDRISGASRFLVLHFGPEALTPPLPGGLLGEDATARDIPTVLGLVRLGPEGVSVTRHGSLEQGGPAESGSVSVVRVRMPARGGPADVVVAVGDSAILTLRGEMGLVRADLAPLVAWLTAQEEGMSAFPADRAVLPLTDLAGRGRGRLIVLDLAAEGPDQLRVISLDAVAVVELEVAAEGGGRSP